MYYTYMLRCEDGSLYTGITTNLSRRFAEHTGAGGKGAKYTASRRPVCYEAAWRSASRSEASKLERRIKLLTKQEKESLVRGQTPKEFDLSAYTIINIDKEFHIDLNC